MKVKGSPSLETPPLVKVGVTVIEVIKGSEVKLSAVNPLIKPEPSSVWSRPILSPVATHSYVVSPPCVVEVNSILSMKSPLQTTISSIKETPVNGLTVTV